MSRVEVRICGLGGQGIVSAGQILGRAAVYDGKNVVQTQSYGAEARGSAAKSEVIISEDKIGFPLVRRCDILVAMSQNTLDANIKDLKEKATLIIDEDLIKKIPENNAKIYKAPITKTAKIQLKSEIYANIVMLGILTNRANVVTKTSMEKAIKKIFKASAAEANLKAYKQGLKL